MIDEVTAPTTGNNHEVVEEENSSKTDMFQLLVDENKNIPPSAQVPQQGGLDMEQWKQFQEFQRMQQQQQTVEV